MKKLFNLFVVCFCFISFKGYSQCTKVTTDINLNPYVCGTYGDANGMSKWDWESNDCEMWRANIGTGVLVNMKSPFIDAPTSALDLIYQSDDYKRSKGWELLRRDFGCSHDVAYPYFVLYNKYTGLVRVFIYKPVERPEYSSVLIQVEPTKASWPATTSLGDALVTAPDKFTSTGASDNFGKTLVSVSEITGSGQWTLAEFIAGFDPNIQNGVYAGTGLKITLFGITNSNVVAKIRGRSVTGTESAIYNYSYVPKTPAPDNIPAGQTVDFLTTGEKFTKYGKAISDGRDQIHTAADKIWNSLAQVSEWDKTVKGRIKKAAVDAWDITRDDMGFGKVLGHIGDVIGAAGGALKILGGVIGLFSGGNGTPAAAPLYTSYDLELNGTINTRYTSQSFIIRTPGTIAVGTSNAPYYQCPLGIFNLRNTPEADVVTYERAYKKQYLGLDDNIPIGIRANFISLKMRNDLQISFNSDAGLELVSAQAAIIGQVLPNGENAAYDLLKDHVIKQFPNSKDVEYNFMLPDLQAGILETTVYEPEHQLHTFQTPYVNIGCINGLAFNARAETKVFLRVKAILKKKNDPENLPIYYIRDYNIKTFEADIDSDLREDYKKYWSMDYLPPYTNYFEAPSYANVDKLINNNQYTGNSIEQADNTISAGDNVYVKSDANVIFKAGYEVELYPGFEAATGSNFESILKINQLNLNCSDPVVPFQYTLNGGNCYNTSISALREETRPITTINEIVTPELLKIYPIPTNGKLFIEGVKANSKTTITILDQSGRSVKELRPASFDGGRIDVDVSSLSNGVYFVKIQTLEQIITRKIVVTK